MNKIFEVEFYYRSNLPEDIRMLRMVQATLGALKGMQIDLRLIDVDRVDTTMPEGIPAVPCLRRIAPTPERVILGMINSPEDIHTVLGIPKTIASIDTDRFNGWTGLRG